MCVLQSGETVIPLGDAPLVFGREPGSAFGKDHPGMSRRHAVVSRRPGGGYQIEDLNSRNGTYLNGVRVNGVAALTHGDRLQITDFLFRFLPAAATAVPPGDQAVAGAHPGPDYLAPEQIDEELGPPSPATDLHAVAVMAFHMLTGELPFTATKQHLRSEAIARRTFRSCATVCRQRRHDSSLAEIIDHCLNGRYALTHHLLRDLTDAVVVPAPPAAIAIGPALDEPLRVEGLLFEDKLGEAHAAIGSRSGSRVTLRLLKPSYDIPPLRPLFRGPFPPADAPPAIARCFHSGRAVPVPVGPGMEVVVAPAEEGVGALAAVEEYLGVRTLAAAIAAGEFVGDDAAVAGVLVPVVAALRYAHARRVVHGRLNPHCVFLTDRGPRIDGFAPTPDPPPPPSAPYPLGRYATTEGHWMNEGGEPHSASTITGSRLAEVRASDLAAPERLRLTFDLTARLAAATDPHVALDELADRLMQVFRQAERCAAVLGDPTGTRPQVMKTRSPAVPDQWDGRALQEWLAERKKGLPTGPAAVACAPLVGRGGETFGAILLDAGGGRFQALDLLMIDSIAAQAGVMVENLWLRDSLLRRDREKRELELARQVQLGMLPKAHPHLPGYEFFTHYAAAAVVGGDYYDFVLLPDGRLVVLLGDVAGKGVPAAMLMTQLTAEARAVFSAEPDTARAMARLNDRLLTVGLGDRFIVLVALTLDPLAHTAGVVCAGVGAQECMLWRALDGTVVPLQDHESGGVPLGVIEGFEYTATTVRIEAGDVIVLCTDGIADSQNSDGAILGQEGLHGALLRADRPTARTVGEQVVRAAVEHAGLTPLRDDIAVVCVGRTA